MATAWQCELCGLNNNETQNKCQACFTSRFTDHYEEQISSTDEKIDVEYEDEIPFYLKTRLSAATLRLKKDVQVS